MDIGNWKLLTYQFIGYAIKGKVQNDDVSWAFNTNTVHARRCGLTKEKEEDEAVFFGSAVSVILFFI